MTALLDLQQSVAARLADDSLFSGVPVFTEAKGDPYQLILAALAGAGVATGSAGRSGLAVRVMTPEGESTPAEYHDGLVVGITLRVVIHEHPAINHDEAAGHGIPSLHLLYRTMELLQGWTPGPGRPEARFLRFGSLDPEEASPLSVYFADFAVDRVFTNSTAQTTNNTPV